MKITLTTDIGFKHPDWDVDFAIWNQPFTDPHDHTYFEVFIVTEGTVSHNVNGQKERLSVGDVRFIRPSDYHSQRSSGPTKAKTVNLGFTRDFLDTCSFSNSSAENILSGELSPLLYRLEKPELDYALFLSEKIMRAKNKDAEKSLIRQLIILCFNRLPSSTGENFPKWLTDFIALLESPENFTLPVGELMKRTNYAPSTLSVLFKKYTGQTVVAYLGDIKIKYACSLLRNTNFTMLEISNRLGYFSLSHFNHIFKKAKQTTPTEYRRNHQTKTRI